MSKISPGIYVGRFDKEKIMAFIDDYCRLVLKHKMQFSFGFTDLNAEHNIAFSDIAIEAYTDNLVVRQTYPNRELAKAVRCIDNIITQ